MRTTKTYTTPLGRTLEVNEYMTEKERRQIKAFFTDAIEYVETGASENGFRSRIIDKNYQQKAHDKTLEIMVASYNGLTEKAAILKELAEEVPASEYTFVIETINALTEEKKTS